MRSDTCCEPPPVLSIPTLARRRERRAAPGACALALLLATACGDGDSGAGGSAGTSMGSGDAGTTNGSGKSGSGPGATGSVVASNTASGANASGSASSGPIDPADFEARCAAPGVLRCVGFDDPSSIEGTFGSVSGILDGAATPELDTTEKASGQSSLRFRVPTHSGANTSGSYFTNFSDDFSAQFDGNASFFVQWRQRFTAEQIETVYQNANGWKQIIIGAGDQPGCAPNAALTIESGGHCTSSCTELETVVQNSGQRRFAQMYNSCTGSASHGAYDPFEEPFGSFDFKLQNARTGSMCLYSQGQTDPPSFFPPQGNCLGYVANEWMTFQIEIATGPREGDEFKDSHVRLWIARAGAPSELVLDWGPYNLTAGDPAKNLRFGKVWLLPYNTGKSTDQDHPEAFTWYDELIVSSQKIADPL